MYPIIFQIGGLTFYSHGVLIVAGIFAGALLVYFLAKKLGLSRPNLFDNIIYTTLAGIIGSRLAYLFSYPNQFQNPIQFFRFSEGGLISYGGFIAGGLTLYLLLKSQKQPVMKWFDLFSAGLLLGLAFGRAGDYLTGDYGAMQASGVFSLASNPLLESFLCLLVIVISLLILLVGKERFKEGTAFFVSVLIYSGGRFIIEFWRGDPDFFLGMSFSQIFSILVFIISLGLFILIRKMKQKGANYEITG